LLTLTDRSGFYSAIKYEITRQNNVNNSQEDSHKILLITHASGNGIYETQADLEISGHP